jgi:hypothetical protein
VPKAAAVAAAAGEEADTGSGFQGICQQQQQQQQQQRQQQRQQQGQQQGLHLRSFSSGLPAAVDMLAVLNPHSLADVSLELEYVSADSATLGAALLRLSSLQRLRLLRLEDAYASPGSALTALAHLSQLASVEIGGDMLERYGPDGWGQPRKLAQPLLQAVQQLLVQPLPLQELILDFWQQRCELPMVDMAPLTKLTKLDVSAGILAEESVLPAQLQRLAVAAWEDARGLAPVTKLQQLQHLSLQVNFMRLQPLLQLAQLPALQHLALEYHEAAAAAVATAPAWPLLRELVIENWEAPA